MIQTKTTFIFPVSIRKRRALTSLMKIILCINKLRPYINPMKLFTSVHLHNIIIYNTVVKKFYVTDKVRVTTSSPSRHKL